MAMQSIFRLPWGSDPLENRPNSVPVQKMRASPIVDIPLLNKLKRKRTGSPEPAKTPEDAHAKRKKLAHEVQQSAHTAGKRDPDMVRQHSLAATTQHQEEQTVDSVRSMPPPSQIRIPSSTSHTRSSSEDMAPDAVYKKSTTKDPPLDSPLQTCSDLSPLQQMIEHQFNLEILTKHRELRLIDQEMAKCQAALEQLRRCERIPYPGFVGLSEEVSSGRGPSIRSQPGFTRPTAPAPWGVTDGPYAKHYASWLLADPMFDATLTPQPPVASEGFAHARTDSRSTRNSIVSLGRSSKRGSRESISHVAQPIISQPAAIPVPRNKGGPLVIKRMSDNQFVKLICVKCHRGDFSSVQGFLNHCRIAHKLDYKSHEAAAQECGHVLEEHEQSLAVTAPPPVGTSAKVQPPKAVTTPTVNFTSSVTKVHPLNLQIPPRPTWKRQRLEYDRAISQAHTPLTGTPASVPPAVNAFHSTPLVPSLSTPSLSKLFEKRGLGGDLESQASMAREKIDLGLDNDEGDEDIESSIKASPTAKASGNMVAKGARSLAGGQQGTKGHRQPPQRPRPAPLSSARPLNTITTQEAGDSELSPHTADSNPGLVSDHDDDPASDLEEDRHSIVGTSHRVSIGRSCGEGLDMDLRMDGDHDEHSVLVRARNRRTHEDRSGSPSRPKSRVNNSSRN